MPTTTPPLDYATRTALAAVAKLLVTKAISAADAERLRDTITDAYYQPHPAPLRKADVPTPAYEELRLQGECLFRAGLAGSTWEGMGQYAADHPEAFAAYVEECRHAHGQPDVRLTKAMATLAPPPPAIETFMEAIATRQAAEPGLSFVQASDLVRKEVPEVYDRYVRDARAPHLRGQPLVKQAAPPSYAQVMKQVDAEVAAQPEVTREQVLLAMLKAHPEGSEAFHQLYRHYRQYQVSGDALRDRDAAAVAKG